MEKKKTLRETLTEEVLIAIKEESIYDELIWQLVEEGLKKWTIQELREFLGVDCRY